MKTSRTALSEIADRFGLKVIRDGRFTYPAKILTPLEDVLAPLLRADAVKELLGPNGVTAVVTCPELTDLVPVEMALATAANPLEAHDAIHRHLASIPGKLWVDFDTVVSPSARIHPSAVVPRRNVRIMDHAEILPNAVLGERVVVGAGSRVHSHAVVGAAAYEIVMIGGRQKLRAQTGGTTLGRECEVLSGAVVSNSAFGGATSLGDNVVLDGNVTVSHDTVIGEGTRVGGATWLGGRISVGRNVAIGPGCVVANGLRIGEGAKLSLGAVVTRDVEPGEHVSGNFAISHQRFIEHIRSIR